MNSKRVKKLKKAFKTGWDYLKKNKKLPILPFHLSNINHSHYFWRKYKQANRKGILEF